MNTYLSIFSAINLVVSCNIFVKSSQEYHRHHSGKKEDYHKRIQNTKPLDIGVRHRLEDVIPSWRPLYGIILNEINRIGIRYFKFVFSAEFFRYFTWFLDGTIRFASIKKYIKSNKITFEKIITLYDWYS